jgi:hypothetical protein
VKIAFVTAGSAGAGHLVRGAAVARAVQRAGRSDVVRVFSPPSPFLARVRAVVDVDEVAVEPALLRDPRTANDSALARALAAFAPDVVVIDVFWVPLVFVTLPCPAWLLLRSVPPAWLVGPAEARFDVARYARVFAIEPAPVLARFAALPPLVIANRDEAQPRAALLSALRASGVDVDVDAPLRLIARGGLPSDDDVLVNAARARWPAAAVALLDLADPRAPFPAAPLFAGLGDDDGLVAAPGYNLFWEARHMGFAARTTFVPIPRKLDDVAWRAGLDADVAPVDNGADVLVRLLARG